MNKLFNIFLIVVCSFSIFAIYKVYVSYTQQYYILSDLNDDTFFKRDWDFIQNIETDFPNISITSIPLNSLKAQYYLVNDSILEGFNLVDKSILDNSNPYIGYPEAIKAKLFNTVGMVDSAVHFSRKSYKLLPRNPFHFSELSRSLTYSKKYDSITEYFKKIKYKPFEPNWRIYFASIANFMGQVKDTAFPKQTAREALKIFKDDALLTVTAYYVLYGQENTKRALTLEKTAAKLMEANNYIEAIPLYKEANSLLPINISFKENISVAYFNLKDYPSVIDNLIKVELQDHELEGLQNYFLGLSYYNLGNISKACERLTMSKNQNFQEALNGWNILCTSQIE
jgi:hypothetical protein